MSAELCFSQIKIILFFFWFECRKARGTDHCFLGCPAPQSKSNRLVRCVCWTFLVYLVRVIIQISNHKYAISISKQLWIRVMCLFSGSIFTLQEPYMSRNVAGTKACVSDFVSLFLNTRVTCVSMPSNVTTYFPNECAGDACLSLQALRTLNRQSDVSASLSSPI